jgi:predicted transcriptional regulator of viral defense system
MSEALQLGIRRRALYAMRDAGFIEQFSRGSYRLASLEPLAHPEFVTIATRVKHSVICMSSALWFHELSSRRPQVVDVAIKRGMRKPQLECPPTRFFWFSGPTHYDGVDVVTLDDVPVPIYDPEKTLVDCFRYRSLLGMDHVLDAVSRWRERRADKIDTLLKYARSRNVDRGIRPFVES